MALRELGNTSLFLDNIRARVGMGSDHSETVSRFVVMTKCKRYERALASGHHELPTGLDLVLPSVTLAQLLEPSSSEHLLDLVHLTRLQ